MPKKKDMGQKMDALGYAIMSKSSNSPSASTRERTATKAMYNELAKKRKAKKNVKKRTY